jgi:hypothetical protein
MMTLTTMRTASVLLFIALLAGCSSNRAEVPQAELQRHADAAIAANETIISRLQLAFQQSLEADLTAGRQPTIDILTLSGGADWGLSLIHI